jgi:hypothetical protein
MRPVDQMEDTLFAQLARQAVGKPWFDHDLRKILAE